MGNMCLILVPKKSEIEDREEVIKTIIDWLVSEEIIIKKQSHCVQGFKDLGFPIGTKAKNVIQLNKELPYLLQANGLEIVTGRRIFAPIGEEIKSVVCPSCEGNIVNEDWAFIDNWEQEKSNNIICPLCNVTNEIHTYDFKPNFGFSDLGFIFWNWFMLKDTFVQEFESKLNCSLDIVYCNF